MVLMKDTPSAMLSESMSVVEMAGYWGDVMGWHLAH
jgi:hypothetical protein